MTVYCLLASKAETDLSGDRFKMAAQKTVNSNTIFKLALDTRIFLIVGLSLHKGKCIMACDTKQQSQFLNLSSILK